MTEELIRPFIKLDLDANPDAFSVLNIFKCRELLLRFMYARAPLVRVHIVTLFVHMWVLVWWVEATSST